MAETERLHELQQKFNENPRRYFAPLANEYRKWGQYDRAAELCRTYLPQLPGHMSGYIVYGQTLFDSGQMEEADSVFHQALEVDPENVIALRHLGDIARMNGNTSSAIDWYEKVLELDPKNEEIAAYIEELNVSSTAEIPIPEPVIPEAVEEEASPVVEPELSQVMSEPTETEDASELEFIPAYREVDPEPVSTAPFVTETLAAVYMDQGLYKEALEVYRQLHEASPSPEIADKIAEIERRMETSVAPEEIQFLSESDEVEHSEVTFETPEMTVTEFFTMIGNVQVEEETDEDDPEARTSYEAHS